LERCVMRRRSSVLFVLVVALILAMGTAASGITTPASGPVLKACPAAVTYPQSACLKSNVTSGAVIMRLLAGQSEWTVFASVPKCGRVTVKEPTSTAAYEVVSSDGVTSAPVTITVAARLSKPQLRGHGHKGQTLTLKGWIAPAHSADSTVALTFYQWQKKATTKMVLASGNGKHRGRMTRRTVRRFQWVLVGDPAVLTLTPKNAHKSTWSYSWTPGERGPWKVVVSHKDVAHVCSKASATIGIKR
jgi:hypothetical protein